MEIEYYLILEGQGDLQGEGLLEAPLVLSKGGWTELRSPKQRHQARRRGRRLEHHGQQEAYE